MVLFMSSSWRIQVDALLVCGAYGFSPRMSASRDLGKRWPDMGYSDGTPTVNGRVSSPSRANSDWMQFRL